MGQEEEGEDEDATVSKDVIRLQSYPSVGCGCCSSDHSELSESAVVQSPYSVMKHGGFRRHSRAQESFASPRMTCTSLLLPVEHRNVKIFSPL